MKAYKVKLEPIEDGYWLATVPSVQGCLAQGRTLRLAQKNIREVLDLFVDDAETADLKFEVALPEDFAAKVVDLTEEIRRVNAAQERARELLQEVTLRGVDMHLSMREVGALVDLSHQRVEQILKVAKVELAKREHRGEAKKRGVDSRAEKAGPRITVEALGLRLLDA